MKPEQIAKTSEHSQQAALFCWCQQNQDRYPVLRWFHAIPNGGDRDIITAGKLKAEGVKAGVLDTFLPVPRKGYHGLYIEMKKPALKTAKGAGVSKEQNEFGDFATKEGYLCRVCYTWIEAVAVLEDYLS